MCVLAQKSDPPDYSVAGESPLGSCHRGGTFGYRATPDKNIIRLNVYHSNSTKRSATAIRRPLNITTWSPIMRGSPKAANAVVIEKRFNRNEHQIVGQCLRDEHSVEGIAVRTWQGPGAHSVLYSDWQFLKVLSSYCPGNVESQCLRVWEFAEPMFGGDFPSRRRADHYFVVLIPNRLPRRSRQSAAPGKPPKERMGVE